MASHRPWMRKIVVLLLGLFFLMPGLFARDWYVRPAGGNYGSENGTSYANAWDGLKNVKWGTGGVQPGDTLYVCGLHLADSFQAQSISVISGTGENARVTIRGDYPGDPGVVWGAYKMAWEPWVYEGNNVWSITLYADMNNDWYFEDITSGSWVVLDKEITLQACQGNPGSFYAASWGYGSKFYVHCSDSGNPTGRIYAPRWGYGFDIHGKQYITFLNLKFYNVYRFLWPGEGYATHIRWEGCTIMYGEHSLITLPDNADYLEVINCDLSWAANGIYIVSDSNKAASYYKFSGNTIHDMGVRPSTRNKDAHGIGVQGGHDGLIENNYIYNCGTGITFFTWTNQECKNTIVRRNFIRDPHTLGGAFGYGIETSSSNDSLSDKSGNIFYQNIVVNAVLGFKLQWEDEQKLYNNVAINCGTSFYSARSYNNYGPKVTARNNISVNPTDRHVIFATSGDDSLCNYDYNLYYPDGAGKFYYNGAYNFSGWKAISRAGYTFDPNSKVADPLFVNPGKENFQLQSSSPAIDAGVSVGLSHDRQGTPIPQGFAPDIGAYEHKKAIFVRASASPMSGGPPLTVNFSSEAIGDFPPFIYRWTFGDGQYENSQNCTHIYTQPGLYTATLTVADSRGNTESQSITIQAYRTYRLSLATNTGAPAPGLGGTTNPPPGNYSYPQASTVPLSAIPYINYRFSQWVGDIISSDSFKQNIALFIDKDKSVAANFCTKCGDVNGDLIITPADAQAAFDIFLGKMPNATPCQKENADVNADGTKTSPRITPMDAQLIFDKYLGRSELPSDCSGNSRTSLDISSYRQGSTSITSIINDLEKKTGDDIFFSIIIDPGSNLSSFGFDLQFPSDKLKPIRLERTELAERFVQVGFNEIMPGLLRVGGYKGNRGQNISSGVLLTLIFNVIKPPITANEFKIVETYDEIRCDYIRMKTIQKKEEKKPPRKYPTKIKSQSHK